MAQFTLWSVSFFLFNCSLTKFCFFNILVFTSFSGCVQRHFTQNENDYVGQPNNGWVWLLHVKMGRMSLNFLFVGWSHSTPAHCQQIDYLSLNMALRRRCVVRKFRELFCLFAKQVHFWAVLMQTTAKKQIICDAHNIGGIVASPAQQLNVLKSSMVCSMHFCGRTAAVVVAHSRFPLSYLLSLLLPRSCGYSDDEG